MKRRALTLGLVGALGLVSGIHAFAAPPIPTKPPITKQPVQISPAMASKLTTLDSPAFKVQELKRTKKASIADKIRAIQAAGAAAQERDLDTPFSLSPRAPYHPSGASLTFHDPIVVSAATDVAYLPKSASPGSSMIALRFTAQPERRYLVDCRVIVVNDTVRMSATTSGGGLGIPNVHASADVRPADGHASLVIPKASSQRELTVLLDVDGDKNQNWGFWDCEITPVR